MSGTEEAASGRKAGKRAAVFRTIGEVAEDLDLPAHVLRFWESKFPQLKPLKRGGGRRYYRPEDIALLSRIRQCLYQEGYTIRGVQKLLSEGGNGPSEATPSLFPLDPLPASSPPARSSRSRRGAVSAPAEASAPAPPELSADGKARLEEARQELLSARRMLDELLQTRRKT